MSAFSKPSPSALPYPGFRDPGAVHGLSTNPAYYTPPQSFGRSKCGTISESIGCDQVFKGIGTSTNSSSARSPAVQVWFGFSSLIFHSLFLYSMLLIKFL